MQKAKLELNLEGPVGFEKATMRKNSVILWSMIYVSTWETQVSQLGALRIRGFLSSSKCFLLCQPMEAVRDCLFPFLCKIKEGFIKRIS